MGLSDITSRQAILDAVAECKRIGQDAFLSKYGFGRAREYMLIVDGAESDSKAVIGAAHGYQFPHVGPLACREFSGGAETVQPLLKKLGFEVRVGRGAEAPFSFPEEVESDSDLIEGSVRSVTVNAYERSSEARRQCIASYGARCCICDFSFSDTYGPIAGGYIQVHHIRRLSAVRREYVVDPIRDLRPVCPNCHAVLHIGGGCLDIEEVRELLH